MYPLQSSTANPTSNFAVRVVREMCCAMFWHILETLEYFVVK